MASAQSVLITGSSTGIGRCAALDMARRGWRVYAGVRKESDADSLRAEDAGDLRPLIVDVVDGATIESAVASIDDEVGAAGLQGVVNNAGITVAGPLEFLPVEHLRTQLEVNVVGLMAVTRAVMPMIRRGGGRVIHVGSISGVLSNPLVGPYCASKFAVEALTDALRLELRPWGIPVSLIQPGPIKTPIWQKSIARAERMREELPPDATELYGPLIDAIESEVRRRSETGFPPERVAEGIAHALTARRPKTRYAIGPQARLQIFAGRWLPDRLRDWVIAKAIGMD